MTLLFGWCLPGDAHHVNDGLPGECPGKVGAMECSCPCHVDAEWEPAPPFRRKRLPRVEFSLDDIEPGVEPDTSAKEGAPA